MDAFLFFVRARVLIQSCGTVQTAAVGENVWPRDRSMKMRSTTLMHNMEVIIKDGCTYVVASSFMHIGSINSSLHAPAS
jgi:hypothetical protein